MKKPRTSLLVALIATCLVVAFALMSLLFDIPQANVIVLSFTLVAVVWYTYFTYQLATRQERAVVVASIHYIPDARDVRVIVSNPTNRYAKTYVSVQPKVYGQEVSLGPDYSGETIWHLTPKFTINGHFTLARVLSQIGKTFDQMVAEANDSNILRQLQLSLSVEWEDEEGEVRSSPKHFWYFNFRKNNFIYQVGGFKTN